MPHLKLLWCPATKVLFLIDEKCCDLIILESYCVLCRLSDRLDIECLIINLNSEIKSCQNNTYNVSFERPCKVLLNFLLDLFPLLPSSIDVTRRVTSYIQSQQLPILQDWITKIRFWLNILSFLDLIGGPGWWRDLWLKVSIITPNLTGTFPLNRMLKKLKKLLHRTCLVNQTVLLLPFCKWHLENQMKYYKLLWNLSRLQQICSKVHLGLILIPEGHTHYLFRKEEFWPIAAAICNNGLAVTKCLAELKKYIGMFVACL